MEGVHETHKASKLASEDVISSMPDSVITNIMNFMPIRDAVRTSILARNWRLKWTLLTQLVIDTEISRSFVTPGPEGPKYYDSRIISRLLLLLKGPITKFSLFLPFTRIFDVGDFNHWVLFLSTKGIKELTVINCTTTCLKLPTYLFSCVELTHLSLHGCSFHPLPAFYGFPNLLSLQLFHVSGSWGGIITGCPLLEILEVGSYSHGFETNDLAKLRNLKKLTLPLRELKNSKITTSSVFQLLGFFQKLENLQLDFTMCEFVVEAVARKLVPTVFPCLNTLTLYEINFGNGSMLSCAFGMIWGSPNLKELSIEIVLYTGADELYVPPTELFSSDLGSSTLGQLQLQSVEITNFRGSKNEECLIKYLLACSPFLRRITIHSIYSLSSDEKLRAAMNLLKLHRASPVDQVDFYKF